MKQAAIVVLFMVAMISPAEIGYGISNPFTLTGTNSAVVKPDKKTVKTEGTIKIHVGETLSIAITDNATYDQLRVYNPQGKLIVDLSKKMRRNGDVYTVHLDKETLKKAYVKQGTYVLVLNNKKTQKKLSREFILLK